MYLIGALYEPSLNKSGVHATIVRRKGNNFEYLELQENPGENGFYPLTESVLKIRFGTKKSRTFKGKKIKWEEYMIDIEKLKDSPKFRELLGFFNTKSVR